MTVEQDNEQTYEDVFNSLVDDNEGDENDDEKQAEEKDAEQESHAEENEEHGDNSNAEEQEENNEGVVTEENSQENENFSDNETSKATSDNDEVAELKRIIAALEQQNAELAHSVKSNAGRVSALQKKNNALEERIAKLQSKSSESSELEDSEDAVQQLLEDYPNLAKGMMQLARQELQKELEPFKQQVTDKLQSSEEAAIEAAREKQIQELDSLIPNWREVANDPFFGNWLATQPEEIQAMAAGLDTSKVVTVFNLYSQHLQNLGFNQGQQTQQEQPEPTQKEKPQKSRKKVADVAPHAGGVVSSSANSGALEDYDALWDSIATRKQRARN